MEFSTGACLIVQHSKELATATASIQNCWHINTNNYNIVTLLYHNHSLSILGLPFTDTHVSLHVSHTTIYLHSEDLFNSLFHTNLLQYFYCGITLSQLQLKNLLYHTHILIPGIHLSAVLTTQTHTRLPAVPILLVNNQSLSSLVACCTPNSNNMMGLTH